MVKVAATEERDDAAEVLRDLRALPEGHQLTGKELMAFIVRMPKMPEGWTSADYIREFRGPLPEDDSDLPDRRVPRAGA
jgi:hypothetical protein